MSFNEAETRFWLIDPVLRDKGYNEHWKLKLETPAPVEPTGSKGRRRPGAGRTDYLLCVQMDNMPKPLPVAVIEAKPETEDPLNGMQQAKGYADCTRFQVRYVFATNGHRYGEFDKTSQMPNGPFPFPDFLTHDDLTARYSKDSGVDVTKPGAALLFMADSIAFPKTRVIGRIMTAVERVRVDSETNLCDILDRVNEISIDHIDGQHFFTLSQVYEDLLLKMGEKNSDGGQFFTPREVVRSMVRVIDPQPGDMVYDPCCGTGGFLAQAYELLVRKLGEAPSSTDLEQLKYQTFFGREKENLR